jgi:DNA-binding MarR family transcriptional regulator
MLYEKVNQLLEQFYKSFYDIEANSLKRGIKNLTTTELHVIEAIGTETITMNELSERLGITMGTATVAVNKLLEKSFIERNRSGNDRRKVFVSLTTIGVDALNYHNSFHKNIISEITKNLSEKELESFVEVFGKILKNTEKLTEFMNPMPVTLYEADTLLEICEIKGSTGVKSFFTSIGLKEGLEVKLISKTEFIVTLSFDSKIQEFDIADAKYISAVKK